MCSLSLLSRQGSHFSFSHRLLSLKKNYFAALIDKRNFKWTLLSTALRQQTPSNNSCMPAWVHKHTDVPKPEVPVGKCLKISQHQSELTLSQWKALHQTDGNAWLRFSHKWWLCFVCPSKRHQYSSLRKLWPQILLLGITSTLSQTHTYACTCASTRAARIQRKRFPPEGIESVRREIAL